MMTHLESLVPQIRGLNVRVRCMAHIINLVVKASTSFTAHTRGAITDKHCA